MITYRVSAKEDDRDPMVTTIRVHVGDREYAFEARKPGRGYIACALNAAMFYSRSLGYGMRVLDARTVGESGGTHTYDITIAKKP